MKLSSRQVVAPIKVALLVGVIAGAVAVSVETNIVPVFHSGRARAQAGAPDPHIDYIHLNGSLASSVTITHGQAVTIKVQATNDAGSDAGYWAGIYMSFPELDSYAAADYVDVLGLSDDLVYREYRPGDSDSPIWYACSDPGYHEAAQVLLIAGKYDTSSTSWNPGEAKHLEVRIRPPRPGLYQVYVKVSTCDSGGSYQFDPTGGAYIDQQCEYVYRRTIEVEPNPGAIYLPVLFRSYYRYHLTLLRGVRTQASSCYDATYCSQRLDCLQEAGATVLYYSIYYREAYYHSDLLPHRSFDSLAYLVPEAHARGMQVYALIESARIGWPQHSGWNARLNHSGVPEDWLDFALPEARSFVADVAEEIVTNYDVDGILLDYTRWESGWFDSAGLSADDVSLTVEGVYDRVKAVRSVPVTASVFRSRQSASWAGQMWGDWLAGGYVDYVTPMAYVSDSELQTLFNDWRDSGYFPERIIPRLSTAWFNPTRAKSVEDVLRQIEMCYDAGATGMTLWDDRYICNDPELVEALGGEGGW